LRFVWCELTSLCNLACRHCYADSGPYGNHGTMPGHIPQWGGLALRVLPLASHRQRLRGQPGGATLPSPAGAHGSGQRFRRSDLSEMLPRRWRLHSGPLRAHHHVLVPEEEQHHGSGPMTSPSAIDMAARLAKSGVIRSDAWRRAVERVPRHVLVPHFYGRQNGRFELVDAELVETGHWLPGPYTRGWGCDSRPSTKKMISRPTVSRLRGEP
jgi:hypothetical protein